MLYREEELAKAKLREEVKEWFLSVGIMAASLLMWAAMIALGWHLFQLASK